MDCLPHIVHTTSDSLPINDPDMENSLEEVGHFVAHENPSKFNKGITDASNPFYPYPNETSLLLGDWYWNQGHHKSQVGFKKLLDIIGDLEYHPEDVWNTNWMAINRNLGNCSVQDDKTRGDCRWLNGDSGWKKATVQICTPFHCHAQHPGPKEYTVEGFHYRSLVDIIHKNISDPTHQLFHYEPYELHWQLPHKAKDVRVYGKLYTSESFLTAHHQLQDSLPEFGCILPRHIIGLMLWLDGTHLTAFGMAKFWPLYVYMGNELKYMCCQPSANLCSHAAYFHTVSLLDSILMVYNYMLNEINSSPMHSKTSQRTMQVTVTSVTNFSRIAIGNYSMCSGEYCWMMNSLKCINMGSSASVTTGLLVDSILTYLHIQLTIQKSE